MISVRYDCEAFLLQKYGGVSKYFSEIIEQFLKFEDLNIKPEFQFNRASNFHLLETLRKFEIELKPAKKFINSKSGWSTLLTYGPLRSIMSAWSSGTKFNIEKNSIGLLFIAVPVNKSFDLVFANSFFTIFVRDIF